MSLNRLAAHLTLGATMACGSLPPAREVTDQRAETARAICEKLGFGIHELETGRAYCHYPQGVAYNYHMYDMPPEAKPITLAELQREIKGKRVALFGEDHENKDVSREELVNIIADEGFDYLGLELDAKSFQPLIDEYYESNDSSKIAKAIGDTHFKEKIIKTITAAKKRGLAIKCIDNRDEADYPDGEVVFNYREVLLYNNVSSLLEDGKRMAILIGDGHISHDSYSHFINGDGENGKPNVVRLDLPLGHRLAKDLGLENVYSVGFNEDSKQDHFIDAYLP